MNDVSIVIQMGSPEQWLRFSKPESVISVSRHEDVLPALREAERAAGAGLAAAGFLAYEAAPGMDEAMRVRPAGDLPLAWFGLFRRWNDFPVGDIRNDSTPFAAGDWTPSVTAEEYVARIAALKRLLAAGETYQVNYSFRLSARFEGDPWGLFCRLCRGQKANHCAFLDTGRFAICSASPELFFSLDGRNLVSMPMKGTARRGLTFEEDQAYGRALRESEKNRAENVMIVDMIRNDMGRFAENGSVLPGPLFEIERYPTVWQMTSTVRCATDAAFAEIVPALFPCASVTGAPKIHTMEIIRDIETTPRGIYTGAAGCLLPGRKAMFNVAIRTVTVDREKRSASYGTGGGVVWDSDPAGEYEECRIKALVLSPDRPVFDLIETLLWEPEEGWFLPDEHLERMEKSLLYFDFGADMAQVERRLREAEPAPGHEAVRARLLVSRNGEIRIEIHPLPPEPERMWLVAPAPERIDPDNPFLYHKTTNRSVYERAKSSVEGCDDALLVNQRGEITESTIANVVLERDGRRVTPPVACGLLPGVFRRRLLETGEISEEVIRLENIRPSDRMFLVNSVRKWIPAALRQ